MDPEQPRVPPLAVFEDSHGRRRLGLVAREQKRVGVRTRVIQPLVRHRAQFPADRPLDSELGGIRVRLGHRQRPEPAAHQRTPVHVRSDVVFIGHGAQQRKAGDEELVERCLTDLADAERRRWDARGRGAMAGAARAQHRPGQDFGQQRHPCERRVESVLPAATIRPGCGRHRSSISAVRSAEVNSSRDDWTRPRNAAGSAMDSGVVIRPIDSCPA